MYTANFLANSDYLIDYLLKKHVVLDELHSRQLAYDIAEDVIKTKEIISEYPRILGQMKNIGKFSAEEMLPMLNNVNLEKRPISVNRTDLYHKNDKKDYLTKDATNFMIIAKPGNRTYKLAKKMEQKFKCVHIDCNDLVEREIRSKSRLGQWLAKNLQLNKILPIEIILWLIQRETTTAKVLYRGYILTGLPIIPNMDLNLKKNFLTEEEFLIFQQIVDEIVDTPIRYRERELANLKKQLFSEYPNLEDGTDNLKEDVTEQSTAPERFRPIPKLFHRITCDRDVRFSIKRQLSFVIDLQNKPTLVIYMDCDDEDIIRKNIIFHNMQADELECIRIALKRYNNAIDVIQQFLCYLPRPNLIYCHGIFTPDETFKSCSDKLMECGIRPVLLADDFYEIFKDDESIIEQLEANSDPRHILDILCKIQPVREDIGWFRSSFEHRCPVMMTRGKCVVGKYQYSVKFTGLIYLPSSDENKRLFLENPQFFINTEPTCRVAVMGARRSGKSTFARCLSKFFDNCVIIDVKYLFDYYRKMEIMNRFYAEACKQVIAELSLEIMDKHNEELQIREDKINHWIAVMEKNITNFLKPIPTKLGKNHKPIPNKKALQDKETLKHVLDEFGFETNDVTYLKTYLVSKDLLCMKLPLDLRNKPIYREPKTSDTEVKKLATERMNELGRNYTMTLIRKLEILVTKIRLCEKRQKLLTKQNKLYGYWILDGIPPDIELFKGLKEMDCLPDAIVYMDDSVGERLAENQNIKCCREFYDVNYVVSNVVRTNKRFFKHMIQKFPLGNMENSKFFGAQVVRRELDHILMQESLDGTTDFQDENRNYRESFEKVKLFLETFDTHVVLVDIHNVSWSDAIICGLKTYMNFFNAHPHLVQTDWSNDEVKPADRIVRYGPTAEYCPVLFVDKMLLKLGYTQYTVVLRNRTYLMSSEEALQRFVQDPFRYCELERPFRIPPYRLCVIGNYHNSKRSNLRRLADILGIKHVSMANIISSYYIKTRTKRDFNVVNFFEILEELGDRLVTEFLAPLFHEGFLFEDFPLTAEHLKQMIELNLYPEQIFYLKIENDHLKNEQLKYYMDQYKVVLLKKIGDYKLDNQSWIEQRKLRFNELMNELPDDFSVEEEEEDDRFDDRLELGNLIDILADFNVGVSSNRKGQIRQLHIVDMVNEEMPVDRYTKLIDHLVKFPLKREVKDFIKSRVAEYDKIKSVADEHLIPFIQIRLHPYTTREIEKSILKHIKESADRQYIFDRAYPINFKNALDFLQSGQFMLSRYFWTCPVRNIDMDYPVKLTLCTPDIADRVQPFIHHEHVYFVQRVRQNVAKFLNRPYLYTTQLNVCQITKPIRLAVHGPRNSGCWTLCERIAKEFQLNNFTLDGMKQYVVKNFKWTKLATELIKNKMEIVDNQQICDLVKISINFETQGWILRDVPLDQELVNCFLINGLEINLIIYLDPTGMDLWTNIKNKYNNEKYKPKAEVLQHLYGMVSELEKFSTHCTKFKGLRRNVLIIKDFTSKWSTWHKAYSEILLLLRIHNLYELRGIQLVAGSLYKLDITDYELEYRLGPLKLYCPMCWTQNKLLVKYAYYYIDDEDADPLYTDNKYDPNLFQYRKYFYWSCNKHLVELMVNAESYLTQIDEELPDELPTLVKNWTECMSLTNDGYCPVAYYESGENDIIIGLPEYSVLYYNNLYIMSSQIFCLQFLQNPDKYKDVKIIFEPSNASTIDEDIENMKLDFGTITPTLVTNALLECAFERPKHYRLDPGRSLEIYLGLYFKCHNASSSNSQITAYKAMFLKYWEECKLVQRNINEMQISGNPYIMQVKAGSRRSARRSSLSTFGY